MQIVRAVPVQVCSLQHIPIATSAVRINVRRRTKLMHRLGERDNLRHTKRFALSDDVTVMDAPTAAAVMQANLEQGLTASEAASRVMA